jgi:hypothetical protein
MFGRIARQASRSQRWQASTQQEEPLLDRALRGDPEACGILGGLLVLGLFVAAYKLMK